MSALAARTQTLQIINALPDSKIPHVLSFVQKISQPKPAPKSKNAKQQALDDLLALWKPVDKEISLNGTTEVAQALLERYEKSFS